MKNTICKFLWQFYEDIFWDQTLRSLLTVDKHFRGICCWNLKCKRWKQQLPPKVCQFLSEYIVSAVVIEVFYYCLYVLWNMEWLLYISSLKQLSPTTLFNLWCGKLKQLLYNFQNIINPTVDFTFLFHSMILHWALVVLKIHFFKLSSCQIKFMCLFVCLFTGFHKRSCFQEYVMVWWTVRICLMSQSVHVVINCLMSTHSLYVMSM